MEDGQLETGRFATIRSRFVPTQKVDSPEVLSMQIMEYLAQKCVSFSSIFPLDCWQSVFLSKFSRGYEE